VAPFQPGRHVEAAISIADAALYKAKAEGRDRVVCATARSQRGTGRTAA